jgi:hypothetical protein
MVVTCELLLHKLLHNEPERNQTEFAQFSNVKTQKFHHIVEEHEDCAYKKGLWLLENHALPEPSYSVSAAANWGSLLASESKHSSRLGATYAAASFHFIPPAND